MDCHGACSGTLSHADAGDKPVVAHNRLRTFREDFSRTGQKWGVEKPMILIAGAGPTGLVLALLLSRKGVPFRLIDEAERPGTASRALILHARTLEYYAMLGIADTIISAGVPVTQMHMQEGGKEVARLDFADFGKGLSPYPTLVSLAQDIHEELLIAELARSGHHVERGVRFESLAQDADGVNAVLHHDDRTEEARFEWVVGADGASSSVRHSLGIGFPGGTYDQRFFVADVEMPVASGGDAYIRLGSTAFLLMLPARRNGSWRLVGVVPEDVADKPDIQFADILPSALDLIETAPTAVNWFSVYHVHHRVADHFQDGRAFLAGDAGHVHSPAGGQGMNTGIGDAINLGWKLAEVASGRAASALLDSYEPERIAFARALVATTDAAFTRIVDPSLSGRIVRTLAAPNLLALVIRFRAAQRAMFRLISQTRISYPDSPLSIGKAGRIDAGDRLPYLPEAYRALNGFHWQLHVHGSAAEALTHDAAEIGLPLHCFEWNEKAQEAGYARDALYLVRPDGHVALASPSQDMGGVRLLQQRFGLRFGA